jgi:hypothetical protein
LEQGGNLRRAEGDGALGKALEQGVQEVGGLGGEALLDALWREGRACACCCVRPVCVSGTGIAGGAEDHHLGEGAACEFALALDEACFACAGVGVVLEDLLERVFDLRCEMGDVFNSALSVPSVWAALKLMPMGRTAVRPYTPLPQAGEGLGVRAKKRNNPRKANSDSVPSPVPSTEWGQLTPRTRGNSATARG